MKPGKYPIVCPQGSTLIVPLEYVVNDLVVDLTLWTARMQVRTSHKATTKILDLTTENGGITLSATTPNISIKVTSTLSTPLTAKTYVYDLELIDTLGEPFRIMEGDFKVTPEVTR